MQNQSFVIFRFIFTGLFIAVMLAGFYLAKSHQRLFGADGEMPSETSSSRAYTKLQVFLVWAHAAVLTGTFALMIH